MACRTRTMATTAASTRTTWTIRARTRCSCASDRIPFEALIGWDAAGNGNLAQLLQEPTLMGAYEGAGITVLGRGVRVPSCNDPTFGANCHDLWGANATGGTGRLHGRQRVPGLRQCGLRGQPVEHGRHRLRHQQLQMQPFAHRRPVGHQQLAGRRWHLHPRLEPQPGGVEHAPVGQPRARSPAASTSATARPRMPS